MSDDYTKSQTDTLLSGKVNAENGKGLSTNNFTTLEKNKLSGIESGATKTIIVTARRQNVPRPLPIPLHFCQIPSPNALGAGSGHRPCGRLPPLQTHNLQ